MALTPQKLIGVGIGVEVDDFGRRVPTGPDLDDDRRRRRRRQRRRRRRRRRTDGVGGGGGRIGVSDVVVHLGHRRRWVRCAFAVLHEQVGGRNDIRQTSLSVRHQRRRRAAPIITVAVRRRWPRATDHLPASSASGRQTAWPTAAGCRRRQLAPTAPTAPRRRPRRRMHLRR